MKKKIFKFLKDLETISHNEPRALLLKYNFGISIPLAQQYVIAYDELAKLDEAIDRMLVKEFGV